MMMIILDCSDCDILEDFSFFFVSKYLRRSWSSQLSFWACQFVLTFSYICCITHLKSLFSSLRWVDVSFSQLIISAAETMNRFEFSQEVIQLADSLLTQEHSMSNLQSDKHSVSLDCDWSVDSQVRWQSNFFVLQSVQISTWTISSMQFNTTSLSDSTVYIRHQYTFSRVWRLMCYISSLVSLHLH